MIFFFLFLTQTKALEIYVSRNSASCIEWQACDGSQSSPFREITEAFDYLPKLIDKIEMDQFIEFILEENSSEDPYILPKRNGSFFSPFEFLNQSTKIRICGITCEAKPPQRAFVSLRTENLILEIGTELTLKNLEIEGRSLPMAELNADCLNTSKGCCLEEGTNDKNCLLFERNAFEEINKNRIRAPYNNFSLLTNQKLLTIGEKMPNSSIIAQNILFRDFNPVSQYTSLMSFVKNSHLLIVLENVEFKRVFFLYAPVLFSGDNNENEIQIKDVVFSSYNTYNIEGALPLDYTFIITGNSAYKELKKIIVSNFSFPGYFMYLVSIEEILITGIKMSGFSCGLFFLMNCKTVGFANSDFDTSFYSGSSIRNPQYLIDIRHSENVSIQGNFFRNLNILNFISLLFFLESNNVTVSDSVFDKIISQKSGALEAENIEKFLIVNSFFNEITSSINGLIYVSNYIGEFICRNNDFKKINGRKAAIFINERGSKINSILFLSDNIVDINPFGMNTISIFLKYAMTITISNVSFTNILKGENVINLETTYSFSGKNYFGVSLLIKNSTIKQSISRFLYLRSSDIELEIDGVYASGLTGKRFGFIFTAYTNNVSIANSKIFDCISREGILHIADLYEGTRCLIMNTSFDNLRGDGRAQTDVIYFFFFDCRFSRMEGQNGNHVFYSEKSDVIFIRCLFINITMNLYSSFDLLGKLRIFSMQNNTFRDINIGSIGVIIIVTGPNFLSVTGCHFFNLTGSSGAVLGSVVQAKIQVRNCSFTKLKFGGRGSIIILLEKGISIIDSSYFSNIITQFNGGIVTVYGESNFSMNSSVVENVFGNKGGVFFLLNILKFSVENTLFLVCKSKIDGAIISGNGVKTVEFIRSKFINVTSYLSGGIFYFNLRKNTDNKQFTVSDCEFKSVEAYQDGGIGYFFNLYSINLTNLKITDTKSINGGAFLVKSCKITIVVNCLFENLFVYEKGGAIFLEACLNFTISQSKFFKINDVIIGAIFYIANSNLTLISSEISICHGNLNLLNLYNSEYSKINLTNLEVSNSSGPTVMIRTQNLNYQYQTIELIMSNFSAANTEFFVLMDLSKAIVILTSFNLQNSTSIESLNTATIIRFTQGLLSVNSLNVSKCSGAFLFESDGIISFTVDGLSLFDNNFFKQAFFVRNSGTFTILHSVISVSTLWVNQLIQIENIKEFNFLNFDLLCFDCYLGKESQENVVINSKYSSVAISNGSFRNLKTKSENLFYVTSAATLSLNLLYFEILTTTKSLFNIHFSLNSSVKVENIIIRGNSEFTTGSFIIRINQTNDGLALDKSTIKVKNLTSTYKDFSLQFIGILKKVDIDDLKITGSNDKYNSSAPVLVFTNANSAVLKKIEVKNSQGSSALFFENSNSEMASFYIENSFFMNCLTFGSGGALNIMGNNNITVRNSTFTYNRASKKGGAIYLRNPFGDADGSLTMINNVLRFNEAKIISNAFCAITDNKKILSTVLDLNESNQVTDNFYSHNNISNQIQISSSQTKYTLRIYKSNKARLVYDSINLEVNLQELQVYSGEILYLETQFFDDFNQTRLDFISSELICDSEFDYKKNYTISYLNNRAKISGNITVLEKMKIVSSFSNIRDNLTCQVKFFGTGTEDFLKISFQLLPISFNIVPCKIGQILRENECKTCEGYSFEKDITLFTKCYPCPNNAICKDGVYILPEKGYWNFNNGSVYIIKCFIPFACPGSEKETGTLCNPEYNGHICSECVPGYGKLYNHECAWCHDSSKGYLMLLLKFLIIAFQLGAFGYLICFMEYNNTLALLLFAIRNFFDLVELFGIVLSSHVMNSEIISPFFAFVSIFSFYGGFQFLIECLTSNLSSQGLRLLIRFFISLLLPIFFIVLTIIFFYIFFRKKVKKMAKIIKKLVFICLYLFIPTVTRFIISIFSCYSLDSKTNSQAQYLILDLDVICYSDYHLFVIVPLIFIFTGIYIALALLLLKNIRRNALDKPEPLLLIYDKIGIKSEIFELAILALKVILVWSNSNMTFNFFCYFFSSGVILLFVFGILKFASFQKNFYTSLVFLTYSCLYVVVAAIRGNDHQSRPYAYSMALIFSVIPILADLIIMITMAVQFRKKYRLEASFN